MNGPTTGRSRSLAGMEKEEVIAIYLPAFMEVCDRLDPGYINRRALIGAIDGLSGPHEEKALTWLSTARNRILHSARVAYALETGWKEATALTTTEREIRPERVLLVGHGMAASPETMRKTYGPIEDQATDWIDVPEGRIVYQDGHPATVLPKGVRKHGIKVEHLRVLVKLPRANLRALNPQKNGGHSR